MKSLVADLPVECLSYGYAQFSYSDWSTSARLRHCQAFCWEALGFDCTCVTTRAHHIEVENFIDTISCVVGTEKFIAWRSSPQVLWWDNETTVTGAENQLPACFKSLYQGKIASRESQINIKGQLRSTYSLIMVVFVNAWYKVSQRHSTVLLMTTGWQTRCCKQDSVHLKLHLKSSLL